MFDTSVIEISKSALENNLNFLRNYLKPGVRISSVIKGNAYGHQIEAFVPLAEACGIDHFSVFNAHEAYRALLSTSKDSTVMIMGMIENDELEWAIKNNVEFYVFDFDRLDHAIQTSKKINKKAIIHIELETGMNRTGFAFKDQKKLIGILKENDEYIEFKALCTHYAGAESIANHYRIQHQIKKFNKYSLDFDRQGLKPKMRHSACSAATFSYPHTQMDMVRIGIMQYGFWSSIETLINYLSKQKSKVDPLIRVLRWKTQIMSIKNVKTGEFIGYGTEYLAQQDMIIGTVPVGYSHGYSRSLSYQGRVLVNDNRVDVIGVVNMNLLIIDLSLVPHTKKGDEVVLIGKQGDVEITVASFSEFSNQLNYELLTRLPQSIPRLLDIS
ncbi:MAG: alanine racemase [Bacteroidetes bacterium]|jgi:alanine racemase|nr:alanine racemase [Bacteroidota bacterium]MBT4287023.1 alanine racemase [Deltaproteobacteria bacterium]MBT5528984.1 alanine racemase [Cytophagia bacterium]MBT4727933.1 alanine racemase [Bacteroidota bacterium]MBT4970596.1 alanine racemase [Bacteroidota bacterium]